MSRLLDGMSLVPKIITSVETKLGYMQVLEYILQDFTYLHVVQWHFNNNIDNNTQLPIHNIETFYKDRDSALSLAHKIGNNLLQQY